jgi:hypothetical protein
MSQTFDRRDVDKSGQLERNELSSSSFPVSKRTAMAAQSDGIGVVPAAARASEFAGRPGMIVINKVSMPDLLSARWSGRACSGASVGFRWAMGGLA